MTQYNTLPSATALPEQAKGEARSTHWRWALAVPVVVFFALAGIAMDKAAQPGEASVASSSFASETKLTTEALDKTSPHEGWYFYKVAYAAKANSTKEMLDFMSAFTYPTASSCESVNLGCDQYKVTCNYLETDSQIHYVVADNFYSELEDGDGMGVSGWIDVATDDFGDFTGWSAFMHEKVSILLPSATTATKQAEALKAAGYQVMKRQTTSNLDEPIAHVLTPVGGKVWEFVATMTEDEVSNGEFVSFAEEECPDAHIVNVDLSYADETQGVWLGSSSAASNVDSDEFGVHFRHMQDIANVHIQNHDSESCKVRTMSMVNKLEDKQSSDIGHAPVNIKYVQNNHYQQTSSGYNISNYEDYVTGVHSRYLKLKDQSRLWKDRWHHWDHFLDTHVGVKFKNSTGCTDRSIYVNTELLNDEIPVGKRAINRDGDHYYSGYPGVAMTMEYNTECHIFVNKSTDICGCVHDNSYKLAEELGVADEYCADAKF